MKQDRRKALQDAFEAPEPQHKEEFFRTIPQPAISTISFMISQAGYIQKWIWAVSIGLFAVSLLGACFMDRDILWLISSLLPFLALSIATESGRSKIYDMAELEMASRFSLRSVVLARMGILEMVHLVLLCLLIPLGNRNNTATILQAGVYLLVPYLLTTVSGLWIVRKFQGREAVYSCMGAAGAVSGTNLFIQTMLPELFHVRCFHWWIAAFLLLAALTIKGITKMIQQTEELTWSLS